MKDIKAFINYGTNCETMLTQLPLAVWSVNIFYILGLFYGVLLGGIELVLGIIIFAIGILSTILVSINLRKKEYKNIYLSMGINSFSNMINFSLLSILLGQLINIGILLSSIIAIVPFLFIISIYILTIKRIKSGRYQAPNRIKASNMRLYGMMGGIMGLCYARLLFNGLEQTTAIVMIIILLMFLSLIFGIGTINLVKYYYIKRFKITF